MPCERCGREETDLGIFDEGGVCRDYCYGCGKKLLLGGSK